MNVKIKKLSKDAFVPEKATAGAAAYDIRICKDVMVVPGRQIISLGFAMEIEPGYEAIIDPRSGFSSKGMSGFSYNGDEGRYDADVLRGKIDSDYRNEVGVIVDNHSDLTFDLKAGTRIAQMTFYKVEDVMWNETDTLSETDRDGGFGSTGTK